MVKVISCVMIALVPFLPGCSLFGSSMQTIRIDSYPREAEVYVNDEHAGQTPLALQVHRGEEVLIKVMKDGYDMRFITTSRSLSTLGMLDVVGGAAIIIPLIGLLSPAAWRHQPPTCMFKLTPVGR